MTVFCVIKPGPFLAGLLTASVLAGQSAAQTPQPGIAEETPFVGYDQPLEPVMPQAPKRQAGERLPYAPAPMGLELEPKDLESNAETPETMVPETPGSSIAPRAVLAPAAKATPSLLDLGALRTKLLEVDPMDPAAPVEGDALGQQDLKQDPQRDPLRQNPIYGGQDTPAELDLDMQTGAVQPRVIQAQQLSSQDVASLGILTEAQSGFSTRIWRSSTATDILSAWPQVPADAPSPAIHAAVKALALSVAAAPPVSDARAWALVEARLDALLSIGALKEAALLSARIPSDFAPTNILKKKADIALWSHQWTPACEAARIGLDAGPSQYWTSITLACRAVKGNRGAVDLLLDVASPEERPTRQLMAAVNALLDASDPVLAAQSRPQKPLKVSQEALNDPLMNAIAVQLGQLPELEQSFLDAPALAHASLANAPGLSLSVRWPGVSALAYRARIDGPDMVQFVAAAPPTTPASPALGVSPRDMQRPLSAGNPTRQVSGLLAISQRGIASGLGQFWAPAIGRTLAMMQPQQILWPDAGAIAAHLAFANEGQALGQWYRHIRTNARSDDLSAAQSLINVWPYAVLLTDDGQAAFTPRLAQVWLQSQSSPADEQARQAVYLYTSLEALGNPIAPELWDAVGGAPLDVAGADFNALRRAVRDKEVGRGTLLAFAALGPDGPKMPEPQALRAALKALVALDQARIARRLAAEVLFFSNVSLGSGR